MSSQVVYAHDSGSEIRVTGLEIRNDELYARGVYSSRPGRRPGISRVPINILTDPATGWRYDRTEQR